MQPTVTRRKGRQSVLTAFFDRGSRITDHRRFAQNALHRHILRTRSSGAGGPSKEEKAMITRTTTAALALAATLLAVPALAADKPNPIGALDQTGVNSLGVDISRAGATPEGVQRFLAWLGPESARGVVDNCSQALRNPTAYHPFVINFCQTAVADQPALGYAPEASGPEIPMMGSGAY
jgi:hypothetical protein